MLSDGLENKSDRTLILKRTNLMFNDKECQVLNFGDISTYKKLRREEEKSKLMGNLYSSVHHDMVNPLKNNVEAAVRLIRNLRDQRLRESA